MLISLLWHRPFAEHFNPTTPAPPELSSWLHLFYAYLQLEEVYAEALEWLNRPGTFSRHKLSRTNIQQTPEPVHMLFVPHVPAHGMLDTLKLAGGQKRGFLPLRPHIHQKALSSGAVQSKWSERCA